ncbi:MAG: sulfide/dihydroorotate dehydrogenase-like FAD/NAD-binding protein [Candidatus Aminicenantes bacterium]|nr:MAG: sulfide/dihydroorotate dehydrogenase-like FAD/NAD-binding protein [Candidatus Aminicenantes bacterium]
MVKILRRERLVPNIHLLEVHAPEVARKCKPGQFVIIMPDEQGERIPLTIADWDTEKGSVTSVFMIVGTSTHKLSLLNEGDDVPVFVGPLGKPSEIENYGTVVCTGGCFGIAAIYPIARALKEAGNKVITLLDVKANFLLYWEDKLKAVSDQFFVSARDSYYDCKDYIPKTLKKVVKKESGINRVISIGCTYLMYTCSEATKSSKIRTMVSLNPIMVDGTGMCGACRVTVDGKTKFACVDGPDFDGHLVDWEELFTRRKAYFEDEVESLCQWEKRQFP